MSSRPPSLSQLQRAKSDGQKISFLTCYDYGTALRLDASQIDGLLVGDSVAMVMHGFDSTIHATLEMMRLHTAAVARGAPTKILVADMPFLEHRKGIPHAVEAAGELLRAGAHAVKIEGVRGHADVIRSLTESGIPVMGHIGLTPQSVLQLGGYKVQGKDEDAARRILDDALELQELGCFALVVECVPRALGAQLSKQLAIPVIGIGAGVDTDGQILVTPDLLTMHPGSAPRFVRRYADLGTEVTQAANRFVEDIKNGEFPSEQESYL